MFCHLLMTKCCCVVAHVHNSTLINAVCHSCQMLIMRIGDYYLFCGIKNMDYYVYALVSCDVKCCCKPLYVLLCCCTCTVCSCQMVVWGWGSGAQTKYNNWLQIRRAMLHWCTANGTLPPNQSTFNTTWEPHLQSVNPILELISSFSIQINC